MATFEINVRIYKERKESVPTIFVSYNGKETQKEMTREGIGVILDDYVRNNNELYDTLYNLKYPEDE